MSSPRLQDREDEPLVAWLFGHSGLPGYAACPVHAPLSDLTGAEQTRALHADTGLRRTRQWICVKAGELGIPRRGKQGPPRTVSDAERRAGSLSRWRRWYAGVKQDPQALADYRRKHRGPSRRREAAVA